LARFHFANRITEGETNTDASKKYRERRQKHHAIPSPAFDHLHSGKRDWSRLTGNENQSWLKTTSRYDFGAQVEGLAGPIAEANEAIGSLAALLALVGAWHPT
jgi:hypothetical protein